MVVNNKLFAFLTVLLTCVIACSVRTKHDHEKELSLQKAQQTNHQFKHWLVDTLRMLDSSIHSDDTSKIVKYQIANDSMQLDIFESYQFVFDKGYRQKDKNTRYIFSLLKEYAEMPDLQSNISFTVHHSYYPSVVKGLEREFVAEVENILVEASDTLIEYGYIRGRLSDKYITVKKKGGKKLHYEFIWLKDKLIKRKIQ